MFKEIFSFLTHPTYGCVFIFLLFLFVLVPSLVLLQKYNKDENTH
jgi:hypothetical protein